MKVLYRFTDTNNGKNRPAWFHKRRLLEQAIYIFRNHDFYLMADNITYDTYTQYLVTLLPSDRIIVTSCGNSKSFISFMHFALQTFSDENEIIYFAEDDYVYTSHAPAILQEGLGIADYVTGYDHRDKYMEVSNGGNPLVTEGGESTRVLLTASSHWKITNSTCMTFGTRLKTLREDAQVFEEHCQDSIPHDFMLFLQLGRNGRKLVSCIPGVCTHCDPLTMAPLIDWEKTLNETTNAISAAKNAFVQV